MFDRARGRERAEFYYVEVRDGVWRVAGRLGARVLGALRFFSNVHVGVWGGFLGGSMIFLEYGWCERVNGSFVVGSFWKVLWL